MRRWAMAVLAGAALAAAGCAHDDSKARPDDAATGGAGQAGLPVPNEVEPAPPASSYDTPQDTPATSDADDPAVKDPTAPTPPQPPEP